MSRDLALVVVVIVHLAILRVFDVNFFLTVFILDCIIIFGGFFGVRNSEILIEFPSSTFIILHPTLADMTATNGRHLDNGSPSTTLRRAEEVHDVRHPSRGTLGLIGR